jgi:GNAT superfamily N-acetyltransferase
MTTAEWALHQRAGLACPGLRTWEQAGLLAVLATDPALGFLSTVSGVVPENVPAAIELAGDPVWAGARPALVVSPELCADEMLTAAGFTRAADRGLAVSGLGGSAAAAGVVDADADEDIAGFLRVLLAGYAVEGAVAAFIEAEHRFASVRRFLVLEHDVPIAAAAMTSHGRVAVLGGASTLRAHRGKGAQSRLLRHRLRVAADAGCTLAVATAVPGSVSAANLVRAGFTFQLRPTWVRTALSCS